MPGGKIFPYPLIEDIFSNLISNAIKYSPAKSTVKVDISDNADSWIVSVADSGEGIAEEEKQNIFERFERAGLTNIKGTGLGLAIAKRIVELHKGTIWVEDNSEEGSKFFVSLPK